MSVGQIIEGIEDQLAEPLPDEVSEQDLELRRRRRIAEENEAAVARIAGMSDLDRSREV